MSMNCPKCNAPLQEGARFCPYCMTKLDEKFEIEKTKSNPSRKKKTTVIIAVILAVVLAVSGSVGFYVYKKAHQPLCTFAQFQVAVPAVSDRMKINDLWDANGFKDIKMIRDEKLIQYSTTTNLHDAFLSVFFYNNGESVFAYFCDITPEDADSAESILKCVVQSTCNYYFSDIDEVFDNEKLYPKKTLSTPFDSDFTDVLLRTEQYNNDIAAGKSISTKYISMQSDDVVIQFSITERVGKDTTLYDMSVRIQRQ